MRLELTGAGMVTSVGFTWPTACAAIRCGLDRFEDTRFKLDGEWVVGAEVPLPGSPRGAAKLLTMAVTALDEALEQLPPGRPADTAWVVCLSEPNRPGRPHDLDRLFMRQLWAQLLDPERLGVSQLLTGVVSPIRGLEWIEQMISSGRASHGIVTAVDSLLNTTTLGALHRMRRLLTTDNSDGVIPGEAAAAIVVSPPTTTQGQLELLGVGFGQAPAHGSGAPITGRGLASACERALTAAGLRTPARCGFADIDYRLTDLDGEQRGFQEAVLALARVMRARKQALELWHPAESVGNVGVATAPLLLGVALAASRRRYAPGPGVLVHVSPANGTRAALVLHERRTR